MASCRKCGTDEVDLICERCRGKEISQIPADQRLLKVLGTLVIPYLNDGDGEAFYQELLDLWDKYKGKVVLDDIKVEIIK